MIVLETGRKILVPRTGGTKSEGWIKAIIDQDHILAEFPLGETYRGNEIPEEYRGETGQKVLSIKGLELI
jgi:hypothetical protein